MDSDDSKPLLPRTPGTPRTRERNYMIIVLLFTLLTVLFPSDFVKYSDVNVIFGVTSSISLTMEETGSRNLSTSTSTTRSLSAAARSNDTLLVGNSTNSTSKTVSLVTSFWAQAPEEPISLHRREIEASILNNLHNPHFDQVVIILDGSTSDANCRHFKQRMTQVEAEFNEYAEYIGNNATDTEDYTNRKRPVLDCRNRKGGQPSYYEMLMYATNPDLVTSDIVVMSNADQAFDRSVQWAKEIKDNTVLAIPTWGFRPDRVPFPTREYFSFVHGEDSKEYQTEVYSRCNLYESSWDAYVFHRHLVAGTLKVGNFQRPTSKGMTNTSNEVKEVAFFKMNEVGAENAALWALMEQLPDAVDVNGCTVIQSWHFHGAPKMHAHEEEDDYWYWLGKNFSSGRVPRPHRGPNQDNVTDSFWVEPPQLEKDQIPIITTHAQLRNFLWKNNAETLTELKRWMQQPKERMDKLGGKKKRHIESLKREAQQLVEEAVQLHGLSDFNVTILLGPRREKKKATEPSQTEPPEDERLTEAGLKNLKSLYRAYDRTETK
ncbi:expressed unknown protein [Seminavis robusta]|uniref:Uncharacterized protein n=1 Tax=Seminavis robusta TaxID=568900 RepID=A0A9N8ES18_9STRA|nr:expressed unknown protein [Seminavis robusta]|eukprot:Sro1938_g306500.1 n/a (546) ;mRNA; f:6296-7933